MIFIQKWSRSLVRFNINNYLYFAFKLFLILLLTIQLADSQTLVALTPSADATDIQQIIMYNQSAIPIQNQTFTQRSKTYNCSLSTLYTYKQNQQQYINNSPYFITLQGITISQQLTISISATYSSIKPSINNTNQTQCIFSSSINTCMLQIQNNCNNDIDRFNYFDIITINIQNIGIFQYYVVCYIKQMGYTFQYGLAIQIIFVTFAVTITAIFSNAWSIAGRGFSINIYLVLIFNGIIIAGGIIAIFNLKFVQIAIDVISWFFSILAVWLCTNQILFLLKFIIVLRHKLFTIKQYTVRVMDVLSLVISIGVCFAWWFSQKNWILNDILSIAIFVAAVKFLKFVSLKQAVICFSITIAVQIGFVFLITFYIHNNYNNIILNLFNSPFQLQVPTINPSYNQKCAWLPITAIIYPGALMSYMRRFDTSRNTKVYLITCVIIFIIGSVVLVLITLGSQVQLPFGLITQPVTITFISIFAWKRKQIKTLWNGQFYDQQFANKQGIKSLSLTIAKENKKSQLLFGNQLLSGLQIKQDTSQLQSSIYQNQYHHHNHHHKKQNIQYKVQQVIEQQFQSVDKSQPYQKNKSQYGAQSQFKSQVQSKSNKTIQSIPLVQIIMQKQKKSSNVSKFPHKFTKEQI